MTTAVLTTVDGPMPVLLDRPVGAAKGAVIVIQEAFGLTGHIASVCARLADAGWLALAPGIYHRGGSPIFDYVDLTRALALMNRLEPRGLRVDLDACFEFLAANGFGPERVGMVGFCMGGAIAMWSATEDRVATAVTWYGGGVGVGRFGLPPLIDVAADLDRPWLGLYGDLDHTIDQRDVDRLGEAAAANPVPTELVRYAAAGHGFNCDDRDDHYQPAAAADGWQRMLEWLDRYIPGNAA